MATGKSHGICNEMQGISSKGHPCARVASSAQNGSFVEERAQECGTVQISLPILKNLIEAIQYDIFVWGDLSLE